MYCSLGAILKERREEDMNKRRRVTSDGLVKKEDARMYVSLLRRG